MSGTARTLPLPRTADAVLAGLLAISPIGWAWKRTKTSMWANFLGPLAAEISRFEGMAAEQLTEVDPRQAVYLLPDYERVLGPDPCGEAPVTLDDRRALVYRRWTARGGQSIAYFVSLGAAMGIPITITEHQTTVCGAAVCGANACAPTPNQYVWTVNLPLQRVGTAVCGGSICGAAACGTVEPTGLECPIRTAAPAHTQPIFNYAS